MKINDDQTIKTMADLYCHGWTLPQIGAKYGVSREYIRQLLERGNRSGICKYTRHHRACIALSQFAEALKTETSIKACLKKTNYKMINLSDRNILTSLIDTRHTKTLFQKNKIERLLQRFRDHALRLHSPTLTTTICDKDKAFHTDYNSWKRLTQTGIQSIRLALGIRTKRINGKLYADREGVRRKDSA